MSLTVTLNSQPVSVNMIDTDFPEWLETSVKGTGFFEWEVRAFKLRLIDVTPAVGQQVSVAIDGTQRLLGTVTAVEDKYSDTPMIECMPFGGVLKDVKAGAEEADEAGRLRWVFELEEETGIQAALEAVLARFNLNKPVHIAGAAWTVSVPGSQADVLGVFAPYGLTRFDERGTDTLNPSIRSSTVQQFVDLGLPVPTRAAMIELRSDTRGVFIGARRARILLGGEYTPFEAIAAFRLPDTGPGAENTVIETPFRPGSTDLVGYEEGWDTMDLLNGAESAAVAPGRAVSYVQRMTGLSNLEHVASIDRTDGVWSIVRRPWASLDDNTYGYAVWWGDPRTQTVSGRWYNKSMADLVKLFTLVSGRWLRFDGTALSLPLRDSDLGSITLPDDGLALDYEQQDRQQTPPEASIQIQPANAEAGSEPEGLAGWNESRVVALNWYYNDRFSGILRTTDAEYIAAEVPAGTNLLAHAVGVGHIIGKDYSTDGLRIRLRMIEEAAS